VSRLLSGPLARLGASWRPDRAQKAIDAAQQSGLAAALVVMGAYFAVSAPRFLDGANLVVILLQVAVIGIIAVPGAMLILSGYIDLSVGSVAGLAGVVFGGLAAGPMPWGLAFVIALGVGLAWGLIQGALIAYGNFSALIVTLGGLTGARGLATLIQGVNVKQGFGNGFGFLGDGSILGVRTPVMLLGVVLALGVYVWHFMPVGRHMKAIGADKDAAFANGVAVRRIPWVLYMVSGLCAALGGLILTSQIDSATAATGTQMEIQVLTAILLGGVSFQGGRGTMAGVVIGILFIGVLDNGLVLLNIGPYYADIATGAALVLAAALDAFYKRIESLPAGMPGDEPEAGGPAAHEATPALDARSES